MEERQESPEKKLTNFRMNISLIFLKGDRSRDKDPSSGSGYASDSDSVGLAPGSWLGLRD